MRPDAMARRRVSALPPTSTMRALPAASRWVSSAMEQGPRRRCNIVPARIRLSPTRKVRAPHPARRSRSAWLLIPLSLTSSVPSGASGARRSVVARSVTKRLRSRLLTPIRRDLSAAARSISASLCTSTSTSMPRSSAAASISCITPSSSAATMIRMASAPMARASATCQGSTMKSLRSTGRSQAARAAIEIVFVALEIGRVGEHREAGRAAGLIGAGMVCRVKISPDQPFGWRSFLDFSDQREARSRFGFQRGAKAARRSLPGGAGIKVAERGGGLRAATSSRLVSQISVSLSDMAVP